MDRSGQRGPAYVDAHVHLGGAAGLDQVRASGVSAVRDAGTRAGAGLALRGAIQGVAVISAGWALFRTGGYGALFGAAVATRNDMLREIERLAEAGAGIIKVMASGMVSIALPETITPGGFSEEDLRFIVDEAGERGLAVMAHANGEGPIRSAISAGVRSVEHGFYMTEAHLERMAERRVFWVPTVGALVRAAEAAKGPGTHIDVLIRSHRAMIARAHEIGVPLAVGTDCVLPDPQHGERYRLELKLFEEAGIPREAVDHIACEGGRELLQPR